MPQSLPNRLAVYYEQAFDQCSQQMGDPCGPERARKKADQKTFRDVTRPAIGAEYGAGRKILFVGMNPGNYEADKDEYDKFLDKLDDWEDRDFRQALFRMSKIAANADVVDPTQRVAWINLVKCASEPPGGGSTNPSDRMWHHCLPKVRSEIEMLDPDLIVELGNVVHYRLTGAAATWGWPVRNPKPPYDGFWHELTLPQRRQVGVFRAFHPNGYRSPRKDWKAIQSGHRPSDRVASLLSEEHGELANWKAALSRYDVEGNGGSAVGAWLEDRFLNSKARPIPFES